MMLDKETGPAGDSRTDRNSTTKDSAILNENPEKVNPPRTDAKEAVGFLRRFNDDGIINLSAFHAVEDKSDRFNETDDPTQWIEEHNADKNIYFSPNEVRHDFNGTKAKKTDIIAMRCVVADLDPRTGYDQEEERERIRRQIEDSPLKPSIIIDSGSGYQLFWLLKVKIPVQGNIEELERQNLRVRYFFDGDKVQDINRVMRVPGTINHPTKTKKKKGRTKCQARLIYFGNETYSFDDFDVFGELPSEPKAKTSGPVDFNDLPQVDIDALPISDDMKEVAKTGKHLSEPENYQDGTDRSAALFAVLVAMAAKSCDDDLMAAVCLTLDSPISDHVRDQPKAEAYAKKQIAKARDYAVDEDLAFFNDRHAVVSEMGKTGVINFEHDEILNRQILTRSSFTDFRNRFNNKLKMVSSRDDEEPKFIPKGNFWLDHSKRRQYDGVVFAPEREVEGMLNLWQGFAVEPRPGDWSLLRNHILEIVCGSDVILFHYFVCWLARCVQRPGEAGEIAVVMRGGQGSGKSIVACEFGALFGQHFIQISDSRHLVGHFNVHLEDAVVLFADEAFWAGDKQGVSALKRIITEKTLTIEAKFRNPRTARNVVHVMMASNSDWVVPAGPGERRYLVLDVSDARVGDRAYFSELIRQMEKGGRAALLHDLITMDLSDFEVRDVPQTTALRDQKILSMEPWQGWWYQKLFDGRILTGDVRWQETVPKDDLYDDYDVVARKAGISHKGLATHLGMRLSGMLSGPFPKTEEITVTRTRTDDDGNEQTFEIPVLHWVFPPLDECRKFFEKVTKAEFDWPADEDEEAFT